MNPERVEGAARAHTAGETQPASAATERGLPPEGDTASGLTGSLAGATGSRQPSPSAAGSAGASPQPVAPSVVTTIYEVTVGDTHYVLKHVELPPGANSGWHYHDGPVHVLVTSGELTHIQADCTLDGVFTAGQIWHEPPGKEKAHIAVNNGNVMTTLEVLYVLPVGAPAARPLTPEPACDLTPMASQSAPTS